MGSSHTQDGQYLRIFIRKIRRKIEETPEQPKLLKTELGVGYRLLGEPTF